MKTIRYYNIGTTRADERGVLLSLNRVDGYFAQTKRHSHTYVEVFCFLDGQGSALTDEGEIAIEKGGLLVVPPGCMHALQAEGALSFYSLLLDGVTLFGEPTYCGDAHAAGEYIEKLAAELSEQKQQFTMAADGLTTLICAEILRLRPAPEKPKRRISRTAAEAKAIIDSRYNEPLTLMELASRVFVNRYALVHAFKRAYDTTPMQYLNAVRINRAEELLIRTTDTVTEIAQAVGFDNPVYFAEQFKKAVGTTPSVFRKVNRV